MYLLKGAVRNSGWYLYSSFMTLLLSSPSHAPEAMCSCSWNNVSLRLNHFVSAYKQNGQLKGCEELFAELTKIVLD